VVYTVHCHRKIVVGQMDNDPALEIAVCRAAESSIPSRSRSSGRFRLDQHRRLRHRRGRPGRQLLIGDSQMTSTSAMSSCQSMTWFVGVGPVSCSRLIDVDGDGFEELLVGWADSPVIRVVNFVTAVIGTIVLPYSIAFYRVHRGLGCDRHGRDG
jgi:hypothetical protein